MPVCIWHLTEKYWQRCTLDDEWLEVRVCIWVCVCLATGHNQFLCIVLAMLHKGGIKRSFTNLLRLSRTSSYFIDSESQQFFAQVWNGFSSSYNHIVFAKNVVILTTHILPYFSHKTLTITPKQKMAREGFYLSVLSCQFF